MASAELKGVFAPVITPFDSDLPVDHARLVSHCRWLLSQDCGLALHGTNSEANSLSIEERISLLDAVAEAGLAHQRMMPGIGCCSLPDTIALTRHAVGIGCAAVLMLPPFYYKGVSGEGLFDYSSELIQRVGDSRLRIYLNHVPPVAQVPLPPSLLERLVETYPETIVGMKYSGGDWSCTHSVLTNFSGFEVLVGSKQFLLAGMRHGGIGGVSELTSTLSVIQAFPTIPALKAVLAHHTDCLDWATVRPPLVSLSPHQRHQLIEMLSARGFTMPGLKRPR